MISLESAGIFLDHNFIDDELPREMGEPGLWLYLLMRRYVYRGGPDPNYVGLEEMYEKGLLVTHLTYAQLQSLTGWCQQKVTNTFAHLEKLGVIEVAKYSARYGQRGPQVFILGHRFPGPKGGHGEVWLLDTKRKGRALPDLKVLQIERAKNHLAQTAKNRAKYVLENLGK